MEVVRKHKDHSHPTGAMSSPQIVRIPNLFHCVHGADNIKLVNVYDFRYKTGSSKTAFNFGSDFARLKNWPKYIYKDNETPGSLVGKLVAVFCSVNFWVRSAN